MTKEHFPVTPAIRALRDNGADFTLHAYNYEERGGTEVAARELRVDEYRVIKTLVMEDDLKRPFIILMHGNRQVSTKDLARTLGVKTIQPCDPATAGKHTGYVVGGTSPFGTRKNFPVYIEETILGIPRILINAGRKGLLADMATQDLVRILSPRSVTVAR